MQLGAHFTLAEMTASRRYPNIPNRPNIAEIARLRLLVAKVLDPLRCHLGRPVWVTSGYRDEPLNAAVGGSSSSDHRLGRAVDIKVEGMSSQQLATEILALELPFDQLIWYHPTRGGHVHISYRGDGRDRAEVRHAPQGGGYPLLEPTDPLA